MLDVQLSLSPCAVHQVPQVAVVGPLVQNSVPSPSGYYNLLYELENSYQRSELDLAFTVQPPELEDDSWNDRLSTYLVRRSQRESEKVKDVDTMYLATGVV